MSQSRIVLFALVLAACCGGAPDARAPHGAPGGDVARMERRDTDEPSYPADWFYAQRAFPGGVVNTASYEAARQQAQLEVRLNRASQVDAGATWQFAGPSNIGGRITALAVVPGGTTIYLGSANGGVFRSTNSGTNWTPIFDDENSPSIGALALNPQNSGTLFVGTGEANASVDSYDGKGLFVTYDGGQTWQPSGLDSTARIARVAFDPQDTTIMYAAAMGTQYSTSSYRGLYRSADAGLTWTRVLYVSDSTGATDVVINPVHPDTVYCATWERIRHFTYRRAYGPECGIWRSIDRGLSWTRLSAGLPAPSDSVGRIGLAIAPTRPSTVYAQVGSGTNLGYVGLGFYRSQDGGNTWARRDVSGFSGSFGGFCWYFGDMAVDPTNADRVYCLGVTLQRSTDGGAHFSSISNAIHTDMHAIWINPANNQRVIVGEDGGFYGSTNGGSAWTKSVDLPITQFYAGAVDSSNVLRILGGAQDNGTVLTTGSPTSWSSILGGDGFVCLVDPTNPSVVFAEYQFCCDGAGPQRSTNSGASYSSPGGINAADRFNWCTPVVMAPKNHNVLLVGSQRVYKSTNNGASYTAISGDLTTNPVASIVFGTITTLEISGPNPSAYYAGTDDGRVWRSLDAGGTWTEIDAGLPVRYVTHLTADPVDSGTVYVTLSGYGQDEHMAHVYRSTDYGTTWTSVSSNLPDAPANDVVVDPQDPNTLYLATDVGVWVTRNLGANWLTLMDGMPMQVVADLTLHAPSRKLVAATHGRSQWKLDITTLPAAVPVSARGVPVLAMGAPAPNPSSGQVRFSLQLGWGEDLRLDVYSPEGRRIRRLFAGVVPAGSREFAWNGRDDRGLKAAAGVYFIRGVAGGSVVTRRVIRLD